jgi:hypothetical protein
VECRCTIDTQRSERRDRNFWEGSDRRPASGRPSDSRLFTKGREVALDFDPFTEYNFTNLLVHDLRLVNLARDMTQAL